MTLNFLGPGLFKGYFNNKQATDQALIDLPHITNGNHKLFKTGDLARYNSRGEIVYVTRNDFQIKIRGQRIEPGEIENVIQASSPLSIRHCLVTKFQKNDEDYLVAYVQISVLPMEIELKSCIMKFCKQHLPAYMIPTFIIAVERFPTNANGKIIRQHLIEPDFDANHSKGIVEAQTKSEGKVYEIWRDLLHLRTISVDESFFSIGGNSLLIMKLYSRYQLLFRFHNPIGDLFKYTTIREQAQLLESSAQCLDGLAATALETWQSLNINEGELTTCILNVSI